MPFLILFCFILRGFLFPYHEERSGTDHQYRQRQHADHFARYLREQISEDM